MRSDSQYQERRAALARLAGALERVYQRCPQRPVLAIRWMHLKHPLHELQERLLREPLQPVPVLRVILWHLFRCLCFGMYLSVQLIRLRWGLRRSLAVLRRQSFDVVLRTCCFERVPPADGSDFYFGDLQRRLAQRGLRSMLLCGDGAGHRWVDFAAGQTVSAGECRLPELVLVPLWAPLRMAVDQIRSSMTLLIGDRGEPGEGGGMLEQRVSRLAALACLSQETALTGLMGWIGQQLVHRWHPRAFVTLYEGHAWEACLRQGVKQADPICRTVGYQHTMLFRESLAQTTSSLGASAWLKPDVVLALGHIPLELMRIGHSPATQLVPFGSFRYQDVAATGVADARGRTVLVTPEGIPSEVRTLFTFAAICAVRLPAYTFIFRCHPQVPMSKALDFVSMDVRLPNIVLSERGTLEADAARASSILYRGSSSVMYGILQGLLPIYYDDGGPDRDPLYALAAWRRRCATPEEFVALMEAQEQETSSQVEAEWREAVRYIQDYTGPVDESGMIDFLDAAGISHRSAPCVV